MVFVLMQNMIIGLVDYLLVKNCPNKCWKTENCTECRGGLGKFKLENYDVYSQMYIYIILYIYMYMYIQVSGFNCPIIQWYWRNRFKWGELWGWRDNDYGAGAVSGAGVGADAAAADGDDDGDGDDDDKMIIIMIMIMIHGHDHCS